MTFSVIPNTDEMVMKNKCEYLKHQNFYLTMRCKVVSHQSRLQMLWNFKVTLQHKMNHGIMIFLCFLHYMHIWSHHIFICHHPVSKKWSLQILQICLYYHSLYSMGTAIFKIYHVYGQSNQQTGRHSLHYHFLGCSCMMGINFFHWNLTFLKCICHISTVRNK